MSRSSRRSARPKKSAPAEPSLCPCHSGSMYAECCGRCHTGQTAAPTAEALMRSRYSAFAVRDEAYLLRTWHPRTRPAQVAFDAGQRWTGLEILATDKGSAFHSEGTVTYRARFTDGGRPGTLTEHSRFVRHANAWVYLDGDVFDG